MSSGDRPSTVLRRALELIDTANAEDPEVVTYRGVSGPRALLHGRLASEWVERLDPDASDAQLIAARAHHFRRWTHPRRDYPAGRDGYLRWRRDAKAAHASEVAALLEEAGCDVGTVRRVSEIIRKERRPADPVVQVHEDALCLVFLETQLEGVLGDLGSERCRVILDRTAAKMSGAGLRASAALPLDGPGGAIWRSVLLARSEVKGGPPGA